jgi:isochorismate synthase
MNRASDPQRILCRNAAAANLPFALWRLPYDDRFSLIVSMGEPRQLPVFGGTGAAAFVMAPFAVEDGNLAWHIVADVLAVGSDTRFRSGTGFSTQTSNPVLLELIKGDPGGTLKINADSTPTPPPVTREAYEARVRRALDAIEAGTCQKIVLSRAEARPIGSGVDLIAITERLAQLHPHAFVSLVSSQVTGTWLTATPEVLLHSDADTVETMALAGTQWPPPDTDPSTLTWSNTTIEEQALVATYIREAFYREGFAGVEETAPFTVQAANLCHLRSDFVAPTGSPEAMARLLRHLHPTSAVCGMPKAAARAHILREEGDTRSFYTGYLGPVGLNGKTSLFVNLRSARYARDTLYLHVGGGIVAGSDPAQEWQETVEKTRTIAKAL